MFLVLLMLGCLCNKKLGFGFSVIDVGFLVCNRERVCAF